MNLPSVNVPLLGHLNGWQAAALGFLAVLVFFPKRDPDVRITIGDPRVTSRI